MTDSPFDVGSSTFDVRRSLCSTTRRHFFQDCGIGVGKIALASLLACESQAASVESTNPTAPKPTHFPATAKRVIYLFMAGGPSQVDLFDHKPRTTALFDKDLPESIRMGQRVTNMTAGQSRFPIAPSVFKFKPHGHSGIDVSELLPHTASIVDELAVIKTIPNFENIFD